MPVSDDAYAIGRSLRDAYPAITNETAEPIANAITLVVAEILQAWLDAGSERDVTLEDLFTPIYDHVKGWVV